MNAVTSVSLYGRAVQVSDLSREVSVSYRRQRTKKITIGKRMSVHAQLELRHLHHTSYLRLGDNHRQWDRKFLRAKLPEKWRKTFRLYTSGLPSLWTLPHWVCLHKAWRRKSQWVPQHWKGKGSPVFTTNTKLRILMLLADRESLFFIDVVPRWSTIF